MKTSAATDIHSRFTSSTRTSGNVRIVLAALVSLVLGFAFGAYWYSRAPQAPVTAAPAAPTNQPALLSDSTKAVLGRLESPVQIRFYDLLDPASTPASLSNFAASVDQLLTDYQRQANGRIALSRFNTSSYANADAAAADGIAAFNGDKGEVCYLGIAIAGNGRKESLARLDPAWEQALEFDVSRAIQRVGQAAAPNLIKPDSAAVSVNAGAVEEVKRLIPNWASASVEEGTRTLREASLKDFKAAVDDMNSRIKEAQQQIQQAQNGGSAADQQAALKRLQQIQAEAAERLKQIAAKSSGLNNAFQQLKAAH